MNSATLFHPLRSLMARHSHVLLDTALPHSFYIMHDGFPLLSALLLSPGHIDPRFFVVYLQCIALFFSLLSFSVRVCFRFALDAGVYAMHESRGLGYLIPLHFVFSFNCMQLLDI